MSEEPFVIANPFFLQQAIDSNQRGNQQPHGIVSEMGMIGVKAQPLVLYIVQGAGNTIVS